MFVCDTIFSYLPAVFCQCYYSMVGIEDEVCRIQSSFRYITFYGENYLQYTLMTLYYLIWITIRRGLPYNIVSIPVIVHLQGHRKGLGWITADGQ